jgi:hypothetical protein
VTTHRCDPGTDPGPLTKVRVWRLLVAHAHGDQNAVDAVGVELDGCRKCLEMALNRMAGETASALVKKTDNFLMTAEMLLAAAEAEVPDP